MRSERILQSMQKVVGHDLPNQLVALQSLLQLLKADESSRLSSDGVEYLRRLRNATQRASEIARFLKEMSRINASAPRLEAVLLDAIARELQGELIQQHPKIAFAFDWQWQINQVMADHPTLVRAILELFRCFLRGREGQCQVSATSQRSAGAIELDFLIEENSTPFEEGLTPTPMRWNQHALEQRCEIVLAREWLTLSEANVDVTAPGSGGFRFRILMPSREHLP